MGFDRTDNNFDIEAIRRAAAAMKPDSAPPQADDVVTLDQSQRDEYVLSGTQREAIITEILDMIETLQANRSTGEGNELEGMLTRIQGIIPSGVASAAANALFLEVERRDRSGFAMTGNEEWERAKEEAKKEREERAEADDVAENIFSNQRQLTEQEWDQGSYDFAGERMTGEEIDNLITFMRNPASRQRLIEQRARTRGVSSEQAERDVDNAIRYTELFRKIQMGTATRDERAEFRRLDSDPATLETVRDARNLSNGAAPVPVAATLVQSRESDMRISVAGSQALLDRPDIGATSTVTSTAPLTVASMVSGGDQPFVSAPSLRANFGQAQAATAPLDVPPAPQIAAMAPPAPPPQSVATAGFDV